MPLSEDAHAAVARYRQETVHAVDRIRDLGAEVDALARRLAVGGPLGDTSDPDLARARAQVARARARIAAAVKAAAASREPCGRYVDRAFPT